MNNPQEFYEPENKDAPKEVMTDEKIKEAFDVLTVEMCSGSYFSCYLDLMLSGAGAPSVLIYDNMIFPPAEKEGLDDFQCMEELFSRRQMAMNYLLEKALHQLKEQNGMDNDLAALQSLSTSDLDHNMGVIQALILLRPESLPATRKLYVNEIGPLPPRAEIEEDAPIPTPKEAREIMIILLTDIIRGRLEKFILGER